MRGRRGNKRGVVGDWNRGVGGEGEVGGEEMGVRGEGGGER